ncbi:hypothetical protein AB6A40_006202 [Gnathostoma spinigerum]|uniref:EF-hand domain-containing protein n=1 Tax=Gnathostoma spinigerum TaxID=75299 RepID=A0ABD6EHQ0_9BILA
MTPFFVVYLVVQKIRFLARMIMQHFGVISAMSRKELEVVFNTYDTNGTGAVPVSALKNVLRCLGFEPRRCEVVDLEAKVLARRKKLGLSQGIFNVDDLVDVLGSRLNEENRMAEMRAAFELFDSDSKGYITVEDLRKVTQELGENLDEDQLKEMICEADSSGEGRVTEEEFYKIMKKTHLY